MFKEKFDNSLLWVKALSEKEKTIVIGYCERDGGNYLVKDVAKRQKYIVSPDTICRNTGICDKNGVPLYEHDLLRCRRGAEPFYGYIEWSKFYRRYVVKASFVYGGHYNIEDLSIEYAGNVCLHYRDEEAIINQDKKENEKMHEIDNSYCPSKFKK